MHTPPLPSHAPHARAPCVAVAGLSARMLAQSAARAGFNVVALDIFGDRDTREYAGLWFDIGGEGLVIDRARLHDALEHAARLPRMLGLIVTSGLEPLADGLARGERMPRFIGNGAQAISAVRDPRRFFTMLDEAGIDHPEVRFTRPADPRGWLVKRAHGCGGVHVEPAGGEGGDGVGDDASASPAGPAYFQRMSPGRSMSALFVGARREVSVIGFAEQLSVACGKLPFVHAGSVGPLDLPPATAERITAAIRTIVWQTGLTGLNSIDFLLDGDTFRVLEINARPSSTMALYDTAWPGAWPRGLFGCHLDACLDGDPAAVPPAPARRVAQHVVFAPRGFTASARFSDACFVDPACHDVPLAGTRVEAGQPVCTLVVAAPTLAAVRDELERQHARLLQRIETCHECSHDALSPR